MAVAGSVAWRRPRWVLEPRRSFSPVVCEAQHPRGRTRGCSIASASVSGHYSRRTEEAYVGWIRHYTTAKSWARTFPGSRGGAGEAAATASRGAHARRGRRRSERAARHAETHGGAPLRGGAPPVRVRQAPHQGRG